MKLLFSKPILSGFLLFWVIGISCEAIDLIGLEDEGVLGSWKLETNGALESYLSITEDSLNFHTSNPGQSCKSRINYTIRKIEDNSFFFLEDSETGEEIILAISKNDERIDVRDINDPPGKISKYHRSEIPEEMLSGNCQGNGGNNGNGGNGNKGDVFGNWETFQGNVAKEYISISDSIINKILFNDGSSCFLKESLRVLSVDDSLFTFALDSIGSLQGQLIITSKGNGIEINQPDAAASEAKKYRISEEDFDAFDPECGESENIEDPRFEEITGKWETLQGNIAKTYLNLTTRELTRIESLTDEGCYVSNSFSLENVSGTSFTITDGDKTFKIFAKKSGNNLSFIIDDGTNELEERYKPSKEDFSQFNFECNNQNQEEPLKDFIGQWETQQGNLAKIYLNLSTEALIRFEAQSDENCYIKKIFDVINISGNSFTISDGEVVVNVYADKTGNNINLILNDGTNEWEERYKPSKEDFSQFNFECNNQNQEEPQSPLIDFIGDWETIQGNIEKEYLLLREDSLISIFENNASGCYTTRKFRMELVNENTFNLIDEEILIQVQAEKKGNNIELIFSDGNETRSGKYKPTKQNIEALTPECNKEIVEEETIDYLGQWETFQGNQAKEVLLISETQILSIKESDLENCYVTKSFDVVNLRKNSAVILNEFSDEIDLLISFQGNNIEIIKTENGSEVTTKYKPSSSSIESLIPDCNDNGSTTPDEEIEVLGNWETQQGNKPRVYVAITQDSIQFIDFAEDFECFEVIVFEIINIDGELFTVLNNEGVFESFSISKKGNNLEIKSEMDGLIITENYKASKEDFDTFNPTCISG